MSPLGIASLVLGIIACLICWIPFLGLLVIPLAAIGLLVAIVAITAAIVGKKSSLSFPIGGAVICFVAILIAIFVTGGISGLIIKGVSQANSINQKSGLASDEKWSKSEMVQQGDMQIKVKSYSWDRVFVLDANGLTGTYSEGFFTIKLVLSNTSKTKKIDYSTWRGESLNFNPDFATLTDDNGNEYKRINFGFKKISQFPNEFSLYPGQSHENLLVFELPVENRKWLHLELPASNFGGGGIIRFELPNKDTHKKMPE